MSKVVVVVHRLQGVAIMLSQLLGFVGVLVSLIGWFKYKSILLLVIGTGLDIIETLLEWKSLNVNAKKLELRIFIIGCIIGVFLDIPFYVGGMLAINFYFALVSVLTLPTLVSEIVMFIKFFRN